jgi:hypothetical protein
MLSIYYLFPSVFFLMDVSSFLIVTEMLKGFGFSGVTEFRGNEEGINYQISRKDGSGPMSQSWKKRIFDRAH